MSINQAKEVQKIITEISKKQNIDIDVVMSSAENDRVLVENKAMKSYEISNTQNLSLRVINGQRVGTSKITSFSKDSIEHAVKVALEVSELLKTHEYEAIVAKDNYFAQEQSKKHEQPCRSMRFEKMLELENEIDALDTEGLTPKLGYHMCTSSENFYAVLNSKDVLCYADDFAQSHYYSLVLNKGDQYGKFTSYNKAREFKDLDIINSKEQTFLHSKNFLNAKPLPTGSYDVVFDIDILTKLFAQFMGIFNSKRIIEKKNPFSEKLGEVVAHKELTILDRPTSKLAIDQHYFDCEGFMSEDISLINKGELTSFLYNSATANELGAENNHRAYRSGTSSLSTSCTNIEIQKGTSTLKDLYQGDVFEILDQQGLHSGCNFMTGHFSVAATGYLKTNGEITQNVKGVTISGNFYNMLKDISCIADQLEGNVGHSFVAPKIKFSNLTVGS